MTGPLLIFLENWVILASPYFGKIDVNEGCMFKGYFIVTQLYIASIYCESCVMIQRCK